MFDRLKVRYKQVVFNKGIRALSILIALMGWVSGRPEMIVLVFIFPGIAAILDRIVE